MNQKQVGFFQLALAGLLLLDFIGGMVITGQTLVGYTKANYLEFIVGIFALVTGMYDWKAGKGKR